MILCIETSHTFCSVALSRGRQIRSISESDIALDHASKIVVYIDRCLKDAQALLEDLEAIAISSGPGSYTGLRVGASTAKGLCFALQIPLIGISTLSALAARAMEEIPGADYYWPMIRARKEDIYTAVYDKDGSCILGDQILTLRPDHKWPFIADGSKVVFCNDMVEDYGHLETRKGWKGIQIGHSARNLIVPAMEKHIKKDYCVVESYRPNYVRKPHITRGRKVL